jgi:multidrug efflux pump subunit AcrB
MLPAVLAGVVLMLVLTGTTLNVQSFTGAIMAMGIAVANAILLVSFAERNRLAGETALQAAVNGARDRLRAVLMTATAMIAGMVPIALGSAQTAPLGQAVIGGLAAATVATLFVLPGVYAILQKKAKAGSISLDPDDPESRWYEAS